jgi:UDP-galactopyranose mutase
VYERYRQLSQGVGVVFGGRLGSYQYFDMHQVVGQAMATAKRELGGQSIKVRAA